MNLCFANLVQVFFSSNCDEDIFGVQKPSLDQHVLGIFALFDEPCLWLAESGELSCGRGRKKWMTVSLGTSLASEGICLFVDLWEAQPCDWDPDWYYSWITLWEMIKVYWLDDLTLAYILDHAVCCASAASSGRSLHLIISQLRTKYTSSNCPNHVQRSKCLSELN